MSVKQLFDGTPTTVAATTAALTNGQFTVGGTNATITEFDNSADLWPYAVLRLEISESFGAAPDEGGTVDVYMARSDQGGANDPTPPTLTEQKGATWIDAFRIYGTQEAQYCDERTISLLGIRQCKFFLKNNTGQTMSFSSVGAVLSCEGVSLEDV